MDFKTLAEVIEWTVLAFLFGLMATIAVYLLTGRINVERMLFGRRKDRTHFFNPLKLQLLLTTLAIALQYVLSAAANPSAGMPAVPNEALVVIGFSNFAYLTGKAWTLLSKLTH